MTYPIQFSALDGRLGFVGTSGSGKTYAASESVEVLLHKKSRAIIIDLLGVWYGLRLKPDGKTASGFDVVIFGGPHGDLPINERSGALIGETLATMKESAIVDLSEIGTAAGERRFLLALFAALYKHANKEPVHLVMDEADMYAPQKILDAEGEAHKLLGIVENIVRRGRVKGFIPWLISQRPAVVNKNVLSQVDGLVAFKLTSSQDRDALGAWVEGQADKGVWDKYYDQLPTHKQGEALIWLPQHSTLKIAVFPEKETFDSSRTPKRGEKKVTASPKPLDVDKLKAKLATVEQEAKANDPKELKAEIAKLQAEIKTKPASAFSDEAHKAAEARGRASAATVVDEAFTEGVVIGYSIGARETAEHIQKEIKHIGSSEAAAMENAQHGFRDTRLRQADKLRKVRLNPSHNPRYFGNGSGKQPRSKTPAVPPNQTIQKHVDPPIRLPGSAGISTAHCKVLDAIRWWEVFGKSAPSAAQVAFMAGRKPRGGSWSTIVKDLRDGGLIEASGFVLTDDGRALAAEPETPPSAGELRDSVLARIDASMKAVAEVAIADYPNRVTPATVGEMVGKQPRGGSWNTTIKHLRDLEIIDTQGGIRAQDWLFP